MYVNYYDRKVKLDDENATIGIIICKDKKDAIVEMTLPKDNNQIFASKYETVLPSKEELQTVLEDKNLFKIIYVFLTIFLYLLKCPQSLIL